MAAAMVEGLAGDDILLSPRGAVGYRTGPALPEGPGGCKRNQAVVDACDTIVLSVRPQVAGEVIRPLRFRQGQRIISVIAAAQIRLCVTGSALTCPSSAPSPYPSWQTVPV